MPIAAAVAAASVATSATNASAASPHNHKQPSQDLASALAEVARLKKKLEHTERNSEAQLDLADKRVVVTGGQTVIDEEDRRQPGRRPCSTEGEGRRHMPPNWQPTKRGDPFLRRNEKAFRERCTVGRDIRNVRAQVLQKLNYSRLPKNPYLGLVLSLFAGLKSVLFAIALNMLFDRLGIVFILVNT